MYSYSLENQNLLECIDTVWKKKSSGGKTYEDMKHFYLFYFIGDFE